jgi:hypothetical protein
MWMAERLVPLPATQVVRVCFLVRDRPMLRVKKVALFCNPVSGNKDYALSKSSANLRLWNR